MYEESSGRSGARDLKIKFCCSVGVVVNYCCSVGVMSGSEPVMGVK